MLRESYWLLFGAPERKIPLMKSNSCSPLVVAIVAAFLLAPLWAQDQKPSQDPAVDVKAAKETFQKALKEAKKDPAVAAAFESANIMALKKVAELDPSLAEMANKEIAKVEKAGTKPAAPEGKNPKKDGDAKAPAKETGDKPAQSKDKPAADKKDAGAAVKEGADKPVSAEAKPKKNADKKAPAPEATPGSSATPKNQ